LQNQKINLHANTIKLVQDLIIIRNMATPWSMIDFLKCMLYIQSILVLNTNGLDDISYFLNPIEATLSSENLGPFRKSSSILSLRSVTQGEHISTKRILSPYFDTSLGSSEFPPCKPSIQVILAGTSVFLFYNVV